MSLEEKPIVLCVDEDFNFMFSEVSLLEHRGFEVSTFDNATDALQKISHEPLRKFSIFVIDVMLTPGADREIFSRESTKDFTETGLVLVKRLVEVLGEKFLQPRCILYSRATNRGLVDRIRATSQKYGIRYISRREIEDPLDFVLEIDRMVQQLGCIR